MPDLIPHLGALRHLQCQAGTCRVAHRAAAAAASATAAAAATASAPHSTSIASLPSAVSLAVGKHAEEEARSAGKQGSMLHGEVKGKAAEHACWMVTIYTARDKLHRRGSRAPCALHRLELRAVRLWPCAQVTSSAIRSLSLRFSKLAALALFPPSTVMHAAGLCASFCPPLACLRLASAAPLRLGATAKVNRHRGVRSATCAARTRRSPLTHAIPQLVYNLLITLTKGRASSLQLPMTKARPKP